MGRVNALVVELTRRNWSDQKIATELGMDADEALRQELALPVAQLADAWQNIKVLKSIDKLSLGSMPIQDAIDLAVFIATTQVQMERFLPGEPLCGGPIDVMVLSTAPTREILSFPGKELHHPLAWRETWGERTR